MRILALVLCSSLPTLVACSSEPTATPPGGGSESATPAESAGPAENLAALRAHVTEFSARPEHDAERVTVQHLLVSFAGAGTSARRSKEEAEQLAADLWARIQAGEDFDALVQEHTDDSHPGIYTMVVSGGRMPETFNRSGMVPAFGNTGWRLAVGEFGVAAFDPQASQYGWHIVKRTE